MNTKEPGELLKEALQNEETMLEVGRLATAEQKAVFNTKEKWEEEFNEIFSLAEDLVTGGAIINKLDFQEAFKDFIRETREQAYEDGYEEGYDKGWDDGRY